MTRVYVAQQLLALGPLSFVEFRTITGWPPRVCSKTLAYLKDTGRAVLDGTWRLA